MQGLSGNFKPKYDTRNLFTKEYYRNWKMQTIYWMTAKGEIKGDIIYGALPANGKSW